MDVEEDGKAGTQVAKKAQRGGNKGRKHQIAKSSKVVGAGDDSGDWVVSLKEGTVIVLQRVTAKSGEGLEGDLGGGRKRKFDTLDEYSTTIKFEPLPRSGKKKTDLLAALIESAKKEYEEAKEGIQTNLSPHLIPGGVHDLGLIPIVRKTPGAEKYHS
ncbi:hypothetical protein JCM5353_001292 [Sporobolomyces roseus]